MEIFLSIIISLFILLFIVRKYYTKNGFYEDFHSNGKLKSQTNWKGSVWKNDNRRVGLYKEFSENGVLILEGNFNKNGRKHGIWKNIHEETGGIISTEEWNNGELIDEELGEDHNWINPKLRGSYTIKDYRNEENPETTLPYFEVWLNNGLYCHRYGMIGSDNDVQPFTGVRFTTYLNYKGISRDVYFVGQLKSVQVIKDGNITEETNWDENGNLILEKNEGSNKSYNKVETKESNFGKQYHDFEKNVSDIYKEGGEYEFIKSLRDKLKIGEVYLEDLSKYIKNEHNKYDGGQIMTKIQLYGQIEEITTVYLDEWEKNKDIDFTGFEDVEQYHTLSQKTITELQDLLQDKVLELGK